MQGIKSTPVLMYLALASAAVALRAHADCDTPYQRWRLELKSVELISGPGDAAAEELLLGREAFIQGTHKDTRTATSPFVRFEAADDFPLLDLGR